MFSTFFKQISLAKKLAFTAVFLALSVVANSFIDIDITPNNKITFTYLICFFAAYLLGGLPAFVIGFVGDAIGFLIKPSGVYWLFGLTLGIFALLAGIILHYLPIKGKAAPYIKTGIALVVCYVAITLVLNSIINYYYVKIFLYGGEYSKTFWVYLGGRIGIQSAIYAINVGVIFALLPLIERLPAFFGKKKSSAKEESTHTENPQSGEDNPNQN